MPYPPFAEIETNYTAFQQGQGDNSFPGQEVDTDLANLVEAVDTLNTFVRGVTRSDGEIGNQTIGHDQLKPELSIGLEPPMAWSTATAYEAGDTVFAGFGYYRATADHTSSGSFDADLAGDLWELLIDFEAVITEAIEPIVEEIVEDLLPTFLTGKYAATIPDKASAGDQTIPIEAKRVATQCYDAAVHATKGGAVYRESDASEVSGVNSRFWFLSDNDRYFIIDTNQPVTLTMAGGRGDLVYDLESGIDAGGGNGNGTTSTEGYIRSAGTNDRTAMLALDAFAFAFNIPAYVDADHYITPQTKLTARWVGLNKFANTLWVEYFSAYDGTVDTIVDEIEVGFWFQTSGSGMLDLKVIGQWNDESSSKPVVCVPDMPILGAGGGLGHRGSIILVGEQYYSAAPEVITDVDLRVMVMRAGQDSTIDHFSQDNMMIAVSGYVEHSDYEIGLFGKTNTTSFYVILMLYGMQYDPAVNDFAPFDDFIPNKTQSTIVNTFHPSFNTIRFLTDIDNTTTFAKVGKPYELNGCGPVRVHGYYAKGVPCGAGSVTCGDYTDVYTTPKQLGLPNRGIHIGFIKADNCYQNASSSELSKGGFLVKGGGTVSGRTALYDGTDTNGTTPDVTTLVAVAPQIQWTGNRGIQKFTTQIFDVECDGFDLEVFNSADNPLAADSVSGITVLNGRGHFNLGNVTLRGDCRRGIEIEHFNGDLQIESYEGVGVLSYEFSRGGRFRRIENDRTTQVELNFTSGGTHVAAVGETITGLTSAATGTVRKVRVTSGSFAAGTAAGYFEVDVVSGTFAAENVTLSAGPNDATVSAASTGAYKPGFGHTTNPTENVAIQIVGTTFVAGVLDGNVLIGATKIPLVANLPTQVYTGDRVQVGTVWTVATECIVEPISASVAHSGGPTTVAFGGVKYLTVEPLTAAVSTGATVTVDQRAYARELEAGFRNSQYGLSVNNSRVTNCDISAVRSAGQFGAWIKGGAVVDFVGGLPATVGRSVLTDATVRVEDATTLALFRGVNIPYNPNVSVQIQLPTTPGRIVLDGCRVENVTALHTVAESGTPWSRVRMSNSFTAAGDPIKHGPFAVTPIVQTGGSATGIAVSASSSFLHANSANRYTLEIDVTLGTVSGPTSGTLTVLNDAGGTDWPAPNQATFGTAIVLASGVSIPSHILCSMATDKTITVYQQGTTALTALTDANIATGTRLKLLVSYLAA